MPRSVSATGKPSPHAPVRKRHSDPRYQKAVIRTPRKPPRPFIRAVEECFSGTLKRRYAGATLDSASAGGAIVHEVIRTVWHRVGRRLVRRLPHEVGPNSRARVGAVMAWALVASVGAQPLNDTGQISCYSATADAGTVAAGLPDPEPTDFNRQDCTVGAAAADAVGVLVKLGNSVTPGRDYTKISNAGNVLAEAAELGFEPDTWNCTRDNVTGLTWELKWRGDGGLHQNTNTYTWFDTNTAVNGGNSGSVGAGVTCTVIADCNTTAYRDAVNALTGSDRLCGRTDWRLPTAFELESLVDFSVSSGPTLDVAWFPGPFSTASGYWSGDNVPTSSPGTNGWAMNFGNGQLNAFSKSTTLRVRLVRSGP